MNVHVKVVVTGLEDEAEDVSIAEMGFELDPIAVKVSELLSKCTYDFDGTSVAQALAFLVCEHADELFETVSDISRACKDNFNGSTEQFKDYLVAKLTENETLH